LRQVCDRLSASDVPLWPVAVFGISSGNASFGGKHKGATTGLRTDDYRLSPDIRLSADGLALHRRRADPDCPRDLPVLDELAAA
jgi:hypothetical protein